MGFKLNRVSLKGAIFMVSSVGLSNFSSAQDSTSIDSITIVDEQIHSETVNLQPDKSWTVNGGLEHLRQKRHPIAVVMQYLTGSTNGLKDGQSDAQDVDSLGITNSNIPDNIIRGTFPSIFTNSNNPSTVTSGNTPNVLMHGTLPDSEHAVSENTFPQSVIDGNLPSAFTSGYYPDVVSTGNQPNVYMDSASAPIGNSGNRDRKMPAPKVDIQ